jgi:hypothetical protein
LRRLLVFGTGAAVIGILLTIVAFYEAYLIVSSLQTELGNVVTNQTLLLEDATLEAVFLGVMVALGYGLISKGLDGIRKQELLELEEPAEELAAREVGSIGMVVTQLPSRPMTKKAVVTTSKSEQGSSTQGAFKSSTTSAASTMGAASGSPRTDQQARTSSDQKKSDWLYSLEAESKTKAIDTNQVQGPPLQTQSAVSASPDMDQSSTTTAVTDGGVTPMVAPEPEKMEDSKSGEITWEGGAPPALEGVEVLPEPSVHGAEAAMMESPTEASGEVGVNSQPAQAYVSGPAVSADVPVKRKRGRPKGSKSSKPPVVPESS